MKYRKTVSWLVVFSFVVFIVSQGCSIRDDEKQPIQENDGTVTINGQLGDGFSVARGITKEKSIAGAVSQIASIPVIAGTPNLGEINTTPIQANGSFSVQLAPKEGESTLLLLTNDQATSLEEKAIGFVTLSSEKGADLLLYPFDLASRDLDFGVVDMVNGTPTGTNDLESYEDAFTADFDKILETAYHDNLFKDIKNQYVNTDREFGIGAFERTRCYFNASLKDATNTWLDLEKWKHVGYSNMRIDVISPAGYTYDDIENSVVDIELIPPQQITVLTTPPIVVDQSNPIRTSMLFGPSPVQGGGLSCTTGEYFDGRTGYVLEFSCDELLQDGVWNMNLTKGTTKSEIALFDLQSASPFDKNGSFLYYMPRFKVTTDQNSKITSIDLLWYAWNPFVGEHERVLDFSTFARLASTGKMVTIVHNLTPGDYKEELFTNSMIHCEPLQNWYIGDTVPSNGISVQWIDVWYMIAGVEYKFSIIV